MPHQHLPYRALTLSLLFILTAPTPRSSAAEAASPAPAASQVAAAPAAAASSETIAPEAPVPWVEIDDDDGVKVYRRALVSSDLNEFRGVGVVKAGIPKIVALLADASKMPDWIDGCVKGELLEKNFDDRDLARAESDYYEIAYAVNSAPWPLQNRDYVLKSSVRFIDPKGTVPLHVNVYSENITHPKKPRQDGLVRIPLMRTNIDLTPVSKDETLVDFSVIMDPGGIIPDAVVNMVTRRLPLKTLQSLAELVQTKDYNRDLEKLVSFHYEKHIKQVAH